LLLLREQLVAVPDNNEIVLRSDQARLF
jgi:hypothetical protein